MSWAIRSLFAGTLLMAMSQSMLAQEDDPPFSTSDTDVGYIDSAIPATQFRLRFDAAYNNPFPDRAEFFYRATPTAASAAESRVDYQDASSYFEVALRPSTSAFVEGQIRFLNPELNTNTSGFGDLQVGFKQLLWTNRHSLLSFQLRSYLPTGDADERLGTDHVRLEPGLLYLERLGTRTKFEGELRLWVPIGGSETANGEDFAGEILRYGIGLSHDLCRSQTVGRQCGCDQSDCSRTSGVFELVGWSILDGFGTITDPSGVGVTLMPLDGDTILNAKVGIRWTDARRSIYLGYGRALTGDLWYQNILRAEYALRY